MKGKVILSALLAAACAMGSFAFAACGDGSGDKENAPSTDGHRWKTTWSINDTYHWHDCEDCASFKDKQLHYFDFGDCVCGKKAPDTSSSGAQG